MLLRIKLSSFIGAYHYGNILDYSLTQNDLKGKGQVTGS